MIILGVMAIVILYAAFDYLAPQKKISGVDMAQKTAELKTFVTDLTAGLGKDASKNLGTLIFSRAEKEWTQDPFLDSKAYKSWTQVKVPAKEAARRRRSISSIPAISRWTGNEWPSSTAWSTGKARVWKPKDTC